MNVYKKDIACIGDYAENNIEGYLNIKSLYPITNSDEIMLREILLEFGNYRILHVYRNEDGVCFETNLPFELYSENVNA